MLSDDLRASPMMAHLMDALAAGQNIGHHGHRLVIAWQRQQDFAICPNPDDPDGC
jgi:hypothetical protein